jgi:hypothetical protein
MHTDELTESAYIKAGQFKGKKPTLTITGVTTTKLEDRKGAEKKKGIVAFQETDKGWVLNRTNIECAKAMFGSETDDWVGKRITLFAAPYEGDVAIRVWGSPDISADFQVTIELPRKKPFKMTMHRTAPPAAAAAAPATPAPSRNRNPTCRRMMGPSRGTMGGTDD